MEAINIWRLLVDDFNEKISEDYILIDIRTRPEILQWRIEKTELFLDYYWDDYINKLKWLDKNKKYLIYCRVWNRTWVTLNVMKQLWFKYVYDLYWWIINWVNSWKKIISWIY